MSGCQAGIKGEVLIDCDWLKLTVIKGSGELEFPEFVQLAAQFLIEEDAEEMQNELKEAFRLYDKEGNNVEDITPTLQHDHYNQSVCRLQVTDTSQRPLWGKSFTNWMTNCPQMIWTASLLKSMRMDQEPSISTVTCLRNLRIFTKHSLGIESTCLIEWLIFISHADCFFWNIFLISEFMEMMTGE